MKGLRLVLVTMVKGILILDVNAEVINKVDVEIIHIDAVELADPVKRRLGLDVNEVDLITENHGVDQVLLVVVIGDEIQARIVLDMGADGLGQQLSVATERYSTTEVTCPRGSWWDRKPRRWQVIKAGPLWPGLGRPPPGHTQGISRASPRVPHEPSWDADTPHRQK